MFHSLKKRYRLIMSGLFGAFVFCMTMPVSAYSQDTFPEVKAQKPPKGEWLTMIVGWTLWIGMGVVTLYFIVAAINAVQAVRNGHGSSGDAVKQGGVAIIVLVIFSSLTAFLNALIRPF